MREQICPFHPYFRLLGLLRQRLPPGGGDQGQTDGLRRTLIPPALQNLKIYIIINYLTDDFSPESVPDSGCSPRVLEQQSHVESPPRVLGEQRPPPVERRAAAQQVQPLQV